jgi:hypothetical protein
VVEASGCNPDLTEFESRDELQYKYITIKQENLQLILKMPKFKHITLNALKSTKDLTDLLTVLNESKTMDITMTKTEISDLEQRFFIDIDQKIPDSLFANLLEHFKGEGTLFDKTDLRRV